MTDYDFRALNDKEFEVLVTDLLSMRDGRRYERFKPGRDSGVDGRYFKQNGAEAILQCKHWPASPLERLVRHIEEIELPKVRKLNPAEYVVALSHPLSRSDKRRICDALSPFVKTQADILGREDLNDLLAAHPQVELRHYKLWITSTTVLRHFLNKPIVDRSLFALQEIREAAKLYVPTANHDNALAKLEALGIVIITGPAGIGKTTLADHLALHYVSKDFEFVRIADEIREAEAAYQPDATQLFFFDDFLGRNYLEALSGHEGAHIVQFIRRVSRDKKKRFVLTSRTTILNQGKLLIDTLQTNNLERNEFEVSFESFSEIDKARILYNHIYHSSLEPQFVDELYADRRYRQLISHRNYNPRLIRYITDSERLDGVAASQYWPHAKDMLDNPARVWENPFEAQHDDFGRALILLVTLNARPISEVELSESYSRFIAHPDSKAMSGRRDFLQSLRHLGGSMLSRTLSRDGEPRINLFNPSIGDYVLRRYASDVPSLRAGFCSLRSTSSLRSLFDLERNSLISSQAKRVVLDAILDNARTTKYVAYSADYIALGVVSYAKSISDLSPGDARIDSATDFVAQADCPSWYPDVARVLEWRYSHELTTPAAVAVFVRRARQIGASSTELESLANLISLMPDETSEELWPELEELALEYFTKSVHDEFEDNQVFSGIDSEDTDEAERRLSRLIEQKFDSLGIPISDSVVESIVESFDVSERQRDYFRPEPDYDYREGRTFSAPQIDAIDDLFDRTR